MSRIEPSSALGLIGSSANHLGMSDTNPTQMMSGASAHLSAPRRPQSTLATVEVSPVSIVALSTAMNNLNGPATKVIASNRCLRVKRQDVKESHQRSICTKMEEYTEVRSDHFIKAAPYHPTARSSSTTSPSKFNSFHSNTIGGVQTFHMALADFTGMRVGCENENSDGSSNLSLQYLIRRARRGKFRPCSAASSPITGGTIRCSNPINLHTGARQELAKTMTELIRSPSVDCVPVKDPESRIKVAVDAALSRCTVKRSEEPQGRADSSFVITPRLKKRHSSSSDESATATATDNLQQSKSRKLRSGADTRRNSATSPVAVPSEQRPVPRLPDPSSVSSPCTLLAVSRLMCCRSSIEFFGECSHGTVDCSPRIPTSPVAGDGDTEDRHHYDDVIERSLPVTGAAENHADDIKRVRETLDFLYDQDDHSSFDSETESYALYNHQGATGLAESSSPCRDRQEEDSVVFSVDSIHVRKQQLCNSQHPLFTPERTIHMDLAVDSVDNANDDRLHSHQTRPPLQIACVFDMEAMKDDFVLDQHTPPQLTRIESTEGDEDRSFATVSSLDTNLSAEV